jgi:hypothetical protein
VTTYDAVTGTTGSSALARQEKLADNVAGLRARSGRFTANDRWMLVLGGTLLPLGVVLVLLGWLGASRTPLVFEQVPYLISGGLLGVALVVSGGFVYFAYWMTLMVREARKGREELTAGLARLEVLLAGVPAVGAPGGVANGASYAGAQRLVATRTGTMLHRPDCSVVSGREGLRAVAVDEAGMEPCRICEPLLP